jgi:hypothetical protein
MLGYKSYPPTYDEGLAEASLEPEITVVMEE